ncbi:hypothetical protein ABBQ38_007044 [Trebouxia sp. C0009 RCD-2024]
MGAKPAQHTLSQQRGHSHVCLPDSKRLPAQVHSVLRRWRHQAETHSSDCRLCRPQSKHNHPKKPASQLQQFARARTQTYHRHPVVACSSDGFDDSRIVAGIPVSAANTIAGQSLWQTLQHRQLDFVAEIKQCLHDLGAEGLSAPAQDGQEEGILVSTRRKALLEDVLYYWAVAEAYLTDTSLQASFREALGRTGTSLLAQGSDGIKLQSEVRLLDEQEGQYMIGSVQFTKPQKTAQQGFTASHSDRDMPSASRPSLDSVMGSVRGQALLDSQGSLPSRMSREGAARTYHMYTYWGYFNRRMSARRALEKGTMPGSKASSGIAFGDNSKQQKSYYGEMTNVWRYFENVPDAISELRTKEAAKVADRHLRALFGDQEECLTTLLAWQEMTNEARWFGRALYDAEDLVLQSCRHHMTEQ